MDDNPFDPKPLGLLAGLGVEPRRPSLFDLVPASAPQETSPLAKALAAALTADTPPISHAFPWGAGLSADPPGRAVPSSGVSPTPFFAPPPLSPRTFGALVDLIAPPPPTPRASYLPQPTKPVAPETKRKAFFSFQFDDIMRVNNVRNAWKITHPNGAFNRSFYDSSLWETRKISDPEVIKRLIRSGVVNTSAVCVLAGSNTWKRRWVRYEVARAIIDGRGLLTVHINGINHHQSRGPHPRGLDPLAFMGIGKLQPSARGPALHYLYEMRLELDENGQAIERWIRYGDYMQAIKKPTWLTDPPAGYVIPLSTAAAEYDYVLDNGQRNIGSWIDQAAKQAGR